MYKRQAVALQDDLRILVLSVAVDAGEHIFVDRCVHDDLVERLTARFALICQLLQLTADIAQDLDRHAGAVILQIGLLHIERNVLQRQIRRYPDVIAGRDAGTEPVSYTHLDVYKRQTLSNEGAVYTPCRVNSI